MAKYRSLPRTVEAIRLPMQDEEIGSEFPDWCEKNNFVDWSSERDGAIAVNTLHGWVTAEPGDWIVKGVKGDFYPVKPSTFEATYEVVQ
jgi:hypothetical protein